MRHCHSELVLINEQLAALCIALKCAELLFFSALFCRFDLKIDENLLEDG